MSELDMSPSKHHPHPPSIHNIPTLPTTTPNRIRKAHTCTHGEGMTLVSTQTFQTSPRQYWQTYFSDSSSFWLTFLKSRNCTNISRQPWLSTSAFSPSLLNSTRTCGYIQPLNSSFVKESVCQITETVTGVADNFEDGFCVELKCWTRNVPAGNTFYTRALCCISHIPSTPTSETYIEEISVQVHCQVVFERFSFLKGAIVAGCVEGMQGLYADLAEQLKQEFLKVRNADRAEVLEIKPEVAPDILIPTPAIQDDINQTDEFISFIQEEEVVAPDETRDRVEKLVGGLLRDPRIMRDLYTLLGLMAMLCVLLVLNILVLVFYR